MGKRGPAPKPQNLRILEGNPGRLPLNPDEPDPKGEARCPSWLSDDAKKQWKRIAPTLKNCGLLTRADENCLASYCDALAWYIKISEKLDTVLLEDQHGKRVHPLVTAQRNYAELMIKFGGRLGLSPSDRNGLKVSGKKPKSKWAGKIT